MYSKPILDTEKQPLEVGAMYCCVTEIRQSNGEQYTDFGILVRYCGRDLESGRSLFADADTWDECDIHGDGLQRQQCPVVLPTSQGWAQLDS